jgi:hypothetical protein
VEGWWWRGGGGWWRWVVVEWWWGGSGWWWGGGGWWREGGGWWVVGGGGVEWCVVGVAVGVGGEVRVAALVRRLEGEEASSREVRARVVDAGGCLGVLAEHVHVHPVWVVLAVVVDERPVGVARRAVDARRGRWRLGHHVVSLEARGGAVEWHAAEDARAAHLG